MSGYCQRQRQKWTTTYVATVVTSAMSVQNTNPNFIFLLQCGITGMTKIEDVYVSTAAGLVARPNIAKLVLFAEILCATNGRVAAPTNGRVAATKSCHCIGNFYPRLLKMYKLTCVKVVGAPPVSVGRKCRSQ